MSAENDYFRTVREHKRAPEVKVLGSRFIPDIYPVTSKEEIDADLERIRKEFYDATHHCYAFILGENGEVIRAADDGEPGGTAGKQILTVLQGAELTNVLCIVTRYFGGTKLGTGGLARAYTEAAQSAVAHVKIETVYLTTGLQISYAYDDTALIERLLHEYAASVAAAQYGDRAMLDVQVRRTLAAAFRLAAIERSNGRIKIIQAPEPASIA